MAATAQLLLPTTPSTYHRIISPTLTIPTSDRSPVPVGLLACQRDPLLRHFDTEVHKSSLSEANAKPAAKSGKKAVNAPTLPKGPILEVILHDTILFPEGGGQPTDIGIIHTKKDGVEKPWDVLQVKRHGGLAVHYVKVNGDVEAALEAFSPKSPVSVSLGAEGYDKRYDHMSMHTSQHLLSALLETRLDIPTLSWSLTTSPSPCYVELPRSMSAEEILSIQTEANKLVFEGREVHVEVEELNRETLPGAQTTESGRSVGKALPDDYTGGVKRVIVIDGVDRNPCCGTHLPSIKNLQLFLLPHTEALTRSNTTSTRLYFLAGPRLITHLTSTHSLLTATSSLLSCGAPLVPDRVALVVEERKKAEKRSQDVEEELAKYIAADLRSELDKAEAATPFVKHVHRTDDSSSALAFLSTISTHLVGSAPQDKTYLVVLSSSPVLFERNEYQRRAGLRLRRSSSEEGR